jgi:hypothetical protein
VCNRGIVAVTASLFGLYQSPLLPETCLPSKVFEYLLQCSSFLLHGFSSREIEDISSKKAFHSWHS